MLDAFEVFAFFPEATVAGALIAAACAALGVFVILKRVVFIGIALSEAAACGVAAGLAFGFEPVLGAAALTLGVVGILSYPFEFQRIPRDAALGGIYVAAGAGAILLVAHSGFGLHEVQSLLYGDLILASRLDVWILGGTLLPVLGYMIAFIRPTTYSFLDREAARTLGIRARVWELLFFFALGLAVAVSSKVGGAFLVFCFLVVPPSAALILFRGMGKVMAASAAMAVIAVLVGLHVSYASDLPTNQTITAVACGWLALALLKPAAGAVATRLRGRRD